MLRTTLACLTRAGRHLLLAAAAVAASATAMAAPPTVGANQHLAYFYDTELRNGGITTHLWEENGGTPFPYTEWEKRPSMTFTGKQIDIDGKKYPVYCFDIYYWYAEDSDGRWGYHHATNILFGYDTPSKQYTADYVYKPGHMYTWGHEKGWEGEEFDLDALEDIPDLDQYRHTVYFAHQHPRKSKNEYEWYSPQEVFVHVWGTNGDLTPYARNEHMRNPENPELNYATIEIPDGYSQIYEYTFYYFGGQPEHLLFHRKYSTVDIVVDENGNYKIDEDGNYVTAERWYDFQTGDLDFKEGAVYYYDGLGVATTPIEDPEFHNGIPGSTYTIYFADTDEWVPAYNSKPFMYVVSDTKLSGEYLNLSYYYINVDQNYKKYIKIRDKWTPVYKLTFTWQQNVPLNKMRLAFGNDYTFKHRTTAELPVVDGALYYFAGHQVKTPVRTDFEKDLVDKIPDDYNTPRKGTLYLNLGANKLMEPELWKTPYCHVYSRAERIDRVGSAYYTYDSPLTDMLVAPANRETPDGQTRLAAEKMEQVTDPATGEPIPGFYKYEVDDISKYDDALFYYYSIEKPSDNEADWYETINCHPACRSNYFDATEWSKYVFDIGLDCVHQSYLTYDELMDLRSRPMTGLYLTGNETVMERDTDDDPFESKFIENDHDCYFIDFEVGVEAPASFKLSSINVADAAASHGFSTSDGSYCFQRGWATFNQGIVGCHIDPNADNYQQWYDQHVFRPDGAPSRMVSVLINECMGYNRYCQYPWHVQYDPTGEKGVKYPGHYWMVVDFNTDPERDFNTVVLLDFDPHPHLIARPEAIRPLEGLTNAQAEQLHAGEYLRASEANGKVLFNNLNIASGSIDFQGTGNEKILEEGFEVEYTLYDNYGADLFYKGVPNTFKADYLDLSATAGLTAHGIYYDTKTQKYFHTRYAHGEVLADVMLGAPVVSVPYNSIYLDDESKVSASSHITYELGGTTDIFYYPDYSLTSFTVDNEAATANPELIHANHPVMQDEYWAEYLGRTGGNPWQPLTDGDEFTGANDWSSLIGSEHIMPLTFHRYKAADNLADYGAPVAELDVHAVFPFLSARNVQIQSVEDTDGGTLRSAAPRRNATETAPANLSDYLMTKYTTTTPLTLDFKINVFTGVDNIAVDAPTEAVADGAAELYTLTGVRVDAASAAPGIYIERRDGVARKILIR